MRGPMKGPAAGTGHEGYGRFGIRGRSGSTTSSTAGRSSSIDSNASSLPRPPAQRKYSGTSSKDGSEFDDFLKDRLSPVILRGSGSTVRSTPSSSEFQGESLHESSSSSLPSDTLPKPRLLPSAMTSYSGRPSTERPPMGRRNTSESSEDDVAARYPYLATQRPLDQLSQMDGKVNVRVPAPLNTAVPPEVSSLDSYDGDTPAWSQTNAIDTPGDRPSDGKEGMWLRSREAEVQAKPSRRWNFFQRAQASPRPKGKGKAVETDGASPSITSSSPYRSVAHYAMLDPVEPVDLYEVEQIMQETETSAEELMPKSRPNAKVVPYERRHKSLLPSPPKSGFSSDSDFKTRPVPPRITIRTDSAESPELMRAQAALAQPAAKVVAIERSPRTSRVIEQSYPQKQTLVNPQVVTPELNQAPFNGPGSPNDSPRQSRLSPVGRIPMVVSKRDRDRKLPDNSFSRPFARTQPHPSVKPPGALYSSIRELASPIEGGSQPVSSTSTRSDGASAGVKSSINTEPRSVSTNRTSAEYPATHEFITFAPRKDSDVSYSSSSGSASWIATMGPAQPQIDDPWQEYNDLLDDMMPLKTPQSAGSSLGTPFQYSGMLYNPYSAALPILSTWTQPPTHELPLLPPRANTVPAILSVPQPITHFMQPTMSPPDSASLSDFVDRYGNRSTSTLPTPSRASMPLPLRSSLPRPERTSVPSARVSVSSSRYSRASGHSRSASLPEVNARHSQNSLTPSARFRRDTQLIDIAEDDGSEQAAKANLRFGALMTSKWLSFGRVLFSPAHNEMRLANQPKVLVIDGLGSDWSYYVALTYPGATVYNLGPAVSNGSTAWPGINQRAPSNHRQSPHSSIQAAFPFPKGFFNAVVFRFPGAAADIAYQACIFECKRVLRPGGYLEVAVLDLDLMNMGNIARREVRGLKTRLQQRDERVSLRNLSDVLVRLIGRRGFEGVQRCIVGVPAAGRIPSSQDISSTSSSDASKRPSWEHENPSKPYSEFSFADLLEDARTSGSESGKSNDEGITKMVAKVGRWWYSTCYESTLLGTDKSIWDDHTLLRECEKQGTSFRLLICFAQKPECTARRTVSV